MGGSGNFTPYCLSRRTLTSSFFMGYRYTYRESRICEVCSKPCTTSPCGLCKRLRQPNKLKQINKRPKSLCGICKDYLCPKWHACPVCQKGVLSTREGKFGAFISCSDWMNCKKLRKESFEESLKRAKIGQK